MPKKTYPMMGWFRFWHMVLILPTNRECGWDSSSSSITRVYLPSVVFQPPRSRAKCSDGMAWPHDDEPYRTRPEKSERDPRQRDQRQVKQAHTPPLVRVLSS